MLKRGQTPFSFFLSFLSAWQKWRGTRGQRPAKTDRIRARQDLKAPPNGVSPAGTAPALLERARRTRGEGRCGMNEITRVDFVEHMAAFERRVNERFDLLERLMALGFDDTSDQLRIGIEQIAAAPRALHVEVERLEDDVLIMARLKEW
jgi:hypothetical protein